MSSDYHLHHETGDCGADSAVGRAQYLAREGKRWEHKKEDAVHIEAGNLPAWANGSVETFFKEADTHGTGRNYEEIEFAIPHCLTPAERIEVARRMTDQVVNGTAGHEKQPYLMVVHQKGDSGRENWHCHIMYHAGIEDGIERDAKQWFAMPARNYRHRATGEMIVADPANGGVKKNRRFNSQLFISKERKNWERICNEYLAEKGHDFQIDSRSYVERGIDLEPGIHRGRNVDYNPDLNLERVEEAHRIAFENGERIKKDPSIALDYLTYHRSTFSGRDIQKFAHTHSTSPEQFEEVCQAITGSKDLCINLGENDRGEAIYTASSLLAAEREMLAAAGDMAQQKNHQVNRENTDLAAGQKSMSADQEAAFRHVLESGQVCCVSGIAGAGKSYTLDAVRDAYEREGFRVRGAALAGIAAEGLEQSAHIQSQTIHSLLGSIERGRDRLTSNDVLVIDEAGMVGSRQMHQLVAKAHESGAKLVLVGDSQQLQSVEAGGAFKALAERHGHAEISQIRRQREEWQQLATREFSEGNTNEALERYNKAGLVHQTQTQDAARDILVQDWAAERKPGRSSVILAYTNADVQDLNARARAAIRAELGESETIQTAKGEREFAAGDRLVFLKNDRTMNVKNGSLGTVEQIQGGELAVQLDGGGRVAFSASKYEHLDHGYALTVHKSQGATVDRSYVLASEYMDRHAGYVAMSRHRDQARLYYSTEQFRDQGALALALGRERQKDLAIDFATARGIEADPARLTFQDRQQQFHDVAHQQARDRQQQAQQAALKQIEAIQQHYNLSRVELAGLYHGGKATRGLFDQVKNPEIRTLIQKDLREAYTKDFRAEQHRKIDQRYQWLNDPAEVKKRAVQEVSGAAIRDLEKKETQILDQGKAGKQQLVNQRRQLEELPVWQLSKKKDLAAEIQAREEALTKLQKELKQVREQQQQLKNPTPEQIQEFRGKYREAAKQEHFSSDREIDKNCKNIDSHKEMQENIKKARAQGLIPEKEKIKAPEKADSIQEQVAKYKEQQKEEQQKAPAKSKSYDAPGR